MENGRLMYLTDSVSVRIRQYLPQRHEEHKEFAFIKLLCGLSVFVGNRIQTEILSLAGSFQTFDKTIIFEHYLILMGIIKVAIADDHKIFRKGVILSLRPFTNIKFVQEAENGDDLLNGLPQSQPDVILMDLRMPGKDGIEATKIVSKQYQNIKVLVLSMYEDERFVYHLMENGANGYLLKNAEPQEIRRAIMEVHEKGYYLNNFVNRILLKKSHSRQKVIPSLNSEITLSDKERDVLRFICMEFTAQEIAQKMEISPRTVEAIKDRLMERFGSKNTAGLVFFAVKNNLIE